MQQLWFSRTEGVDLGIMASTNLRFRLPEGYQTKGLGGQREVGLPLGRRSLWLADSGAGEYAPTLSFQVRDGIHRTSQQRKS